MKRRLLALGLVLAVGACDTTQSPSSSVDDLEARADLVQGATADGEAYFKPPIGPGNGIPAGLNPNLLVSFVICEGHSGATACAAPAKVIPPSEVTVDLVDEWYLAEWDTDDRPSESGPQFRIFAVLPTFGAVAYADVELGSSGSDLKAIRSGETEVVGLKDGRTLPIGVRLLGFTDEPSSRAADCVDGIIGSGVIDCDVETVPVGGTPTNPLVVFDDPNAENFGVGQLDPAGSVAYDPACVAGSDPPFDPSCQVAYTIVFEHIPDNPAAGANQPIPNEDAYGFFVRVDAFQDNGNPVVFSPGWTLDLCQTPQTEADLGPLVFALQVFQVKNDGNVEFPPSTNGTGGFCVDAGNGTASIRSDDGSVLSRVSSKLRSLAALVSPRPLFASLAAVTHGGKRTTGLSDFSSFGTTLVTEAAPFGYGGVFGYEGTDVTTGLPVEGVGSGPFYTPGGTAGCPLLAATIPSGTGGVWQLANDNGAPDKTLLRLVKRFTTTATTLWLGIAVDNDVAIKLNGVEVPLDIPNVPSGNVKRAAGFDSNSYQVGGLTYWVHDGCATTNSLVVELSSELVSGTNELEIFAIDRGSVGYVDAAIFDTNPVGITVAGWDAARGGTYRLGNNPAPWQALQTEFGSSLNPLVEVNTLTTAGLTGVDVLVISSVKAGNDAIIPLSGAEQNALTSFVAGGGCAVLFADNSTFDTGGASPVTNASLISPFDVQVTGTLGDNQPSTVSAVASPVTSGVTTYTNGFPGWFDDLDVSQDGGSPNVLATLDINSQPPSLVEFPAGALSTGSGRVTIYSDASLFFAGSARYAPNGQLWVNTVNACLDEGYTYTPPIQ
jgi:hypothetical protein